MEHYTRSATAALSLALLFQLSSAGSLGADEAVYENSDHRDDVVFSQMDTIDPSLRVRIHPEDYTQRIGRLVHLNTMNICTATLVGSNIIITADHCTEDENLQTLPAEEFVFYAGYDDGDYVASSGVKQIFTPDSSVSAGIFNPNVRLSFDDVAFMVLEDDLGYVFGYERLAHEALPKLPNGQFYDTAIFGYNRDYSPYMTAQLECGFNEHFLNPMVVVGNCRANSMDSGGPVFYWRPDENGEGYRREIYAVISTKVPHGMHAAPVVRSSVLDTIDQFLPEFTAP